MANLLFCPSAPALEDLEEFPAPETLKGQILISTKPPKEDEDEEKTQAIVKHHILSAEVAKLHMGKKVQMEWVHNGLQHIFWIMLGKKNV